MEVVQSELETVLVSESAGLLFERFDSVVDSFGHGAGDGVFEEVHRAGSVSPQGFGDFAELLDSGMGGKIDHHKVAQS